VSAALQAIREHLPDELWRRLVVDGDADPDRFQREAATAKEWANELLGDTTGEDALAVLLIADPAAAARGACLLERLGQDRTP
jgi:hypothetical protein